MDCAHKREHEVPGPFENHKAKIICKDCLAFLSWKDRDEPRSTRVSRMDEIFLLSKSDLNEWERSFVKSLESKDNLSDKQEACWQKIRSKYFKDKPKVIKKAEDDKKYMDHF